MSMTDFDMHQMGEDMGICHDCKDHVPCGCDNDQNRKFYNDGLDDFVCEAQSDELGAEYGEYLDHLNAGECPKCGQYITQFELDINDGICPCCSFPIMEDHMKELVGCETCKDVRCGSNCPAPIEPPKVMCESCKKMYRPTIEEIDLRNKHNFAYCCERCGRAEDRRE